MGVAIDAGSICQTILLGDGRRATPGDEIGLDLLAFDVSTNGAVALVSAEAWHLSFTPLLSGLQWVNLWVLRSLGRGAMGTQINAFHVAPPFDV